MYDRMDIAIYTLGGIFAALNLVAAVLLFLWSWW
jgi:hypothetical protein